MKATRAGGRKARAGAARAGAGRLYYSEVGSPVGTLGIASSEKGVCRLLFPREARRAREVLAREFEGAEIVDGSARNSAAAAELREYFAGRLDRFTAPLDLRGTVFQRRVWDELLRIPRGETRSYAEIARGAGSHRAARAVGAAVGRNPVPIIVPCHRVIGSDGSLVGFGGGLDLKVALLEREGARGRSA